MPKEDLNALCGNANFFPKRRSNYRSLISLQTAPATRHPSRVRVETGTEDSRDAHGFVEGRGPTWKRPAPSAMHSSTQPTVQRTLRVWQAPHQIPTLQGRVAESALDRIYLRAIPEQDQNPSTSDSPTHLFRREQTRMGLFFKGSHIYMEHISFFYLWPL